MTDQLIALTGFMAAGKTTVGRALAAELDREFADLDELIAAQQGRTIIEIIKDDGEQHFRRLETAALRELLLNGSARVIALGGGTWALPENRSLLQAKQAKVIWLDAPFALCWQRIEATGQTRPLAHSRESAEKIYRARRQYYALSHFHLDMSDQKSAADVAHEIAATFLQPIVDS